MKDITIDISHYRLEGEGDDVDVIQCHKDDATMTRFVVSSVHPIDRHEFGLALHVTEVLPALEGPYHDTAVKALERYLIDHPEGKG